MDETLSAWAKIRPFAVATGRIVGSILLAYSFIVVLMTAAAQSQVAARLSDLQPKLEYSSGYAALIENQRTASTLLTFRIERRQTAAALAKATEEAEWRLQVYNEQAGPLQSLRLSPAIGVCNLSSQQPLDQALMFAIRQCAEDPDTPAAVKAKLKGVLDTSDDLFKALRSWQQSERTRRVEMAKLQALDSEIKALDVPRASAREIRMAFNEIDILRDRPYLGGDVLVGVPPSITQILLSFFSGMFGALLLTLVLIVYPKTALDMTSPESSYGARIMLGGLIAVCVFIVLGGGTAVLGTASAFAEGKANFMAFSAVSVLAGMFSDRVAHWLSERADTFFATDKEPDEPPAVP